ncbi:hypothetical protein IWQ56_000052 [Coemansia nantahalensis]|nr:hypothetical protein IWQ56_000052 [Coemansia nantahalensis]
MFSFKKARGRQNIRRKEAAAPEDEAADVIKRPTKPRAESKPHGMPGASLGSSGGGDGGEERTYSSTTIQGLKEESSAVGTPEAGGAAYPFAAGGIPDSQQIYMAKKLRRERRAAQAMGEASGAESGDEEDFIRLSDDMEGSRLDDADGAGAGDAVASDPGDSEAGGEDADDAVIVDKNERAAFGRASRRAMEESIAQSHGGDMSDWESVQLRSAGLSAPAAPASRAPLLPEDGGFEFDAAQLRFMIAQEVDQQTVDEARLATARDRLAASSAALEELERSIEDAQRQYDHFLSLAKATAAP